MSTVINPPHNISGMMLLFFHGRYRPWLTQATARKDIFQDPAGEFLARIYGLLPGSARSFRRNRENKVNMEEISLTHKTQANGISIHYRLDAQRNGDTDAPVVMLSNSLMSNLTMWDDQLEALTEDFQVLRYDTRGHGGTDAPAGPYSIELFVGDVAGLLDNLGIEKVHFAGLSMGGFIGQLFSILHPDRVLSLTLCDTACVMPPPSLWNDRIETAERDGIDALIEGTLGRWFTEPFRQSHTREIQRIRDMIRATPVGGYVNCARAIRDMNLCALLERIKAPTHIIVGEGDPACPVSAAETLHAGIAGSRMTVLKDAAHLPNIEKKAEFNTALTGFLKQHKSAT